MWRIFEVQGSRLDARLSALRRALRDAVEKEDYIKAATLRDQIRYLEQRFGESRNILPERQASR
jgi:protein-arginine kinase activator protein McsA